MDQPSETPTHSQPSKEVMDQPSETPTHPTPIPYMVNKCWARMATMALRGTVPIDCQKLECCKLPYIGKMHFGGNLDKWNLHEIELIY